MLNRLKYGSTELYEAVQALMALDDRFRQLELGVDLYITPSGYGFLEFPTENRRGTIDSEATAKEVVQTIHGVAADYHLADDWTTTLCRLFHPQLFEMPVLPETAGISIGGVALRVIPASPADVLLMQLALASELETLPDSFRRIAQAAGFEDAESIGEHYSEDHPLSAEDTEMVDAAMRACRGVCHIGLPRTRSNRLRGGRDETRK